jgi:hypothetical protein
MADNSFVNACSALRENPELRSQLVGASSPEERKQILQGAGVDIPTTAHMNETQANLAAVAGAGSGSGSTSTDVLIGAVIASSLA